MKRAPAVWRTMTADELGLVLALVRCSFLPGSFDKRFVRDLHTQAAKAERPITEKQALLLRRLVTRYRRQIPAGRIPEGERQLLANPPKTTKEGEQDHEEDRG